MPPARDYHWLITSMKRRDAIEAIQKAFRKLSPRKADGVIRVGFLSTTESSRSKTVPEPRAPEFEFKGWRFYAKTGLWEDEATDGGDASVISPDGTVFGFVWTAGTSLHHEFDFTYWPDGKVQSAGLNGVTRSLGYDKNRNLTSESVSVDGYSLTTNYGYDAIDHLKTVTYPLTGTVVDYSPDVLGRPSQLVATRAGVAQTIVSSGIQYYPNDVPQTLTYGNGIVANYAISSRLWPNSVQYKAGTNTRAQFGFGFDAVGNVTSISDSTRPTYGFSTLAYDGLNRLVGVGSSGSPCDICYDNNGNITKLSVSGGSATAMTYDSSNRLSSISGAHSGGYTYDARGNVHSDPSYTYAYDAGSRLSQVSLNSTGASVAVYAYDGTGIRAKSQRAGSAPIYTFYDSKQRALVDWDRNSSATTEYFYLSGKQVAKRSTQPLAVTGGAISLTPAARMVKSSAQVQLSIGLPNTANGTVTVQNGATVIYSGAMTNGMVQFAASALTTKSGCFNLTVSYSGDLNYAPGSIGTTRVCVNFPLAAILELLQGN
jgi:YD repeat-containing protein